MPLRVFLTPALPMRPLSLVLVAAVLVSTSGCATVSPYGDDAKRPTAQATAYAETLLARPPETLTDSERAFLSLYAQQAEARNTQARAQFEQTVYAISAGLSILSLVAFLVDRVD